MKTTNLATAYVGRNPFARGEYARFSFAHDDTGCDWCGRVRRVLFAYIWQDDSLGARVPTKTDAWSEHKFCNKSCHDSYYG